MVGEEWRLRRGAGARMQDQQFPTLLKGSKYADRTVIGTIDHLKNFKHASLRRFYQQWYRPDMMAVVAVGDFDKAEVGSRCNRAARPQALPARSAMARPAFPVPPHDSTYITIATDREATNSSFSIYNVLPRRDMSTLGAFRDRYVERLGLDMLNARMSEITQKPNPPSAAAGASRGYFIRAADTYSVFGGVKEGGLLPGFEAVLTEIERAARFGFSDSELQRAKASRLRNQEMLMANKDKHYSAERASELLRNFLQQEDVLGTEAEYNMYVQIVPTVTLAEVNQVTRAMLAGQNRVITVNAPDKAGANVPTEAQFLAVMQAVKAKQLEPYKDNVVTGPLIAKLPTPGAILSTQVLADLNVTEWKLANGVRVVLKPTDYMADEIILTGTSPVAPRRCPTPSSSPRRSPRPLPRRAESATTTRSTCGSCSRGRRPVPTPRSAPGRRASAATRPGRTWRRCSSWSTSGSRRSARTAARSSRSSRACRPRWRTPMPRR